MRNGKRSSITFKTSRRIVYIIIVIIVIIIIIIVIVCVIKKIN